MTPSGSVKVPLGRIVATPAALGTVSQPDIVAALRRHASGDWGAADPHTRSAHAGSAAADAGSADTDPHAVTAPASSDGADAVGRRAS